MANVITGKTALVTGTSRGIGAATAACSRGKAGAPGSLTTTAFAKARKRRRGNESAGPQAILIGGDLGSKEGIAGFIVKLKVKAPKATS